MKGRTGEECSGTNHCKDTRRNRADPLAEKSAEKGPGVEGRDNDPRWHFATERHCCEDELNKSSIYQPTNVFGRRTVGLVLADP